MHGEFGTARLCLNGHEVDLVTGGHVTDDTRFCSECGKETLCACPRCHAPIRGAYRGSVIEAQFDPWIKPNYCPACAEPYPWTAGAIDALTQLLSEQKRIKPDELHRLAKDLPDLVSETPKTKLAVLHVKQAMERVEEFARGTICDLLRALACDAARKQLGI